MPPSTAARRASPLWAALFVLSAGSAAAAGTPTELIGEGKKLLGEGSYEGALRRFEEAYAAEPAPLTLLAIADVRMKLGQFERAARAFERFLAEVPAGQLDRQRKVASEGLAEALPRLGFLQFDCPVDGVSVSVDRVTVGVTPLAPVRVETGRREIRAWKAGDRDFTSFVLVRAGATEKVELEFTPPIGSRPRVVASAPPAPSPTPAPADDDDDGAPLVAAAPPRATPAPTASAPPRVNAPAPTASAAPAPAPVAVAPRATPAPSPTPAASAAARATPAPSPTPLASAAAAPLAAPATAPAARAGVPEAAPTAAPIASAAVPGVASAKVEPTAAEATSPVAARAAEPEVPAPELTPSISAEPAPALIAQAPSDEPALYERPWVWVVTGALVTAAVVVGVAATTGGDDFLPSGELGSTSTGEWQQFLRGNP